MTFTKQQPRPVPEDFAEQAALMSRVRLARHYQTRPANIVRWCRAAGIPPHSCAGPMLRPIPADFARYAEVETYEQLVRRYGCSSNTITRWRRATGLIYDRRLLNSAPDGFELFAPNHTVNEMRIRYGKGPATIQRWCRETGVTPRKASAAHIGAATRNFSPQNHAHRDTTRAGLAADFLRHLGPVFRCTPEGRAKPDGTHWNRGGRTVLTDDEIIARAVRNGWNPDAWQEVHAA